jgi:hypothetical protein
MNREIMGKMFSKFFENNEKISGLNAKLISVDDDDNFIFDVRVDDGISYQRDGIINYLYETILEFLKIIGYADFKFDIRLKDELRPEYIGDDLKDGIETTLSKISEVIIIHGLRTVKVNVEHVSSSIENDMDNSVKIINYVKAISGEVCMKVRNVEECLTVDAEFAVDKFLEMRNARIYDDSDYNYLVIDELIDKYTLFSDGNQVIYTLTEFV